MMNNHSVQSLENTVQNYISKPSEPLFANAMGLSRTQPSPAHTLSSICAIIQQQSRWLTILDRLAIKNYQQIFTFCIDKPSCYPALINQLNNNFTENFHEILSKKIFQLSSTNIVAQILWGMIGQFIESCSGTGDRVVGVAVLVQGILEERLGDLEGFKGKGEETTRIQKDYGFLGWEYIVSLLAKLYSQGAEITRKRLASSQYKVKTAKLLSYLKTSLKTLLCLVKPTKHQLSVLVNLLQLPELSLIFYQNRMKVCEFILQAYIIEQVVEKVQRSIEDRVHFQYGIVCEILEKGEEEEIAQFISAAVHNISGLLELIFSTLINNTQLLSHPQQYLKLTLIHPATYNKQINSLAPLITHTFANLLSVQMSLTNQVEICRQIRFLVFYSQFLSDYQFQALINLCLKMLDGEVDSFGFLEGYCLLGQVLGQKKQKKSRAEECGGEVVRGLMGGIARFYQNDQTNQQMEERRNSKLYKLCQLLQTTISNCPSSLIGNLSLLANLPTYTLLEHQKILAKSRHKTSAPLSIYFRILLSILPRLDDNYYLESITSYYNLLTLLENPYQTEHVEDLLKIVEGVILWENSVEGNMVAVLMRLGRVVQYYGGNVLEICGVVKSLCSKGVVSSVCWGWKDLMIVVCQIVGGFFSSYLRQREEYCQLYTSEWHSISHTIQLFLQSYSELLVETPQLISTLENLASQLPNTEERLQLLLTLHLITPFYSQPFSLPEIKPLSFRYTLKLLFKYYLNKLHKNYNERLLQEYMKFQNIYQNKLRQHSLKNDENRCLPFGEINIEVQVREVFKDLVKRGIVDKADSEMVVSGISNGVWR